MQEFGRLHSFIQGVFAMDVLYEKVHVQAGR
jgi:hypothetical protein